MKIRMERGELLAGLSRVQGVVERRNTVPILSNILLEANSEGVHLFATDLEIGLKGTYPAEVLSPGAVTLPARKLFEIVRELPEGLVEVMEEAQWVTVTAGRSRFRVASLPSEDFPPAPEPEGEVLVPVTRDVLSTMIRKTFFAVGDIDTRYVLNGVLVTASAAAAGPASLRMVATNGHRLAVIEREVTVDGPLELSAIVPRKALVEMKKLLEEDEGEVSIGFTDKRVVFKKQGLTMVSQLVEGTFPAWEKVVPEETANTVTLNTAEAIASFRRVSLLCQEKTWAVRFSLSENLLTLVANNPEQGEATEEIAVEYAGADMSTGFNARYFIDVLQNVDGESVRVETNDALSPCLIRDQGDPGYLSLVMPMRL
ncbi:MAG: DNA polymerase III subunit beta [Nitrospirota bacterium]|nr:DNA polymerase III subunit beta [Nitrospirota bacterium]